VSGDLRARASGNDVEKATSADDREAASIRATRQIRGMEGQFAIAAPKGAEAAQLVRDAITLLRQNPKLAGADMQSILGGLMTMAQLGLRPGVLGHGWLVPFWDKHSRTFKAQLIIGYQGLAELAYRSDRIASITAKTVFENDPIWEVEFGTEDRLLHKPLLTGDRGKPIAYYSVAHIKGGRPTFHVMSLEDMIKHRDKYAMAQKDGKIIPGTPWADNFEGMAHKTCFRQLAKWVPKSTDLAKALEVDEGVRFDTSPNHTPEEATVTYEQVPTDPPDAEPPADGGQ
jgi:recombination protein RecT